MFLLRYFSTGLTSFVSSAQRLSGQRFAQMWLYVRLECTRTARHAPSYIHSVRIHIDPLLLVEPVWRNGRAFDAGPRDFVFEPRWGQPGFPLGKEIHRHC